MVAELEMLEAEQKRMAREGRALEEAAQREREENPPTVEERLRDGDEHLAGGRIASALWEYGSAHRIDPRSPEPRVRLGYVHLRQNPDRARPLFESALELDPEHASAHRGLGLSLFADGESDEGIRHLEQAVILAPRSAMAREALGVSLDQMGRHDEAEVQLEEALKLEPHNSSILSNLGSFHLRNGSYENAEKMLRAALRQDSRDVSLRENNLGLALAMQGKFEEALAAFRRAGDEQSARANLGYAYYLRGEYGQAIEEYEQALVAGGAADLQVVRNLKAARHALDRDQRRGLEAMRRQIADERGAADPKADNAGRGAASEVADTEPVESTSTLEAAAPVERSSDDPWLRGAPPPGAPAE
jgi:Flp pilus assembly protein TadD